MHSQEEQTDYFEVSDNPNYEYKEPMKGKLELQLDEDIFKLRSNLTLLDRKYKTEKEELSKRISHVCQLQGNLFPQETINIDKLFDDKANITVAEAYARKALDEIAGEITKTKDQIARLAKRRPAVQKADTMQLSII